MVKKSVKKIVKEEKIIPFNKLSKLEKRVVIAKDVLKQLKTKKFIAASGDYISSNFSSMFNHDISADIKTNYKKIKNCKVCALGACLLTITKFDTKLLFKYIIPNILLDSSPKVDKLFTSIFSPKQLLMIEYAFEGKIGFKYGEQVLKQTLSGEEIDSCINFYGGFPGKDECSEDRLIAIMNNIITNKGIFKP